MRVVAGSVPTSLPDSIAASSSWRCSIWRARSSVAAASAWRSAVGPVGAASRRAVAKLDQPMMAMIRATTIAWTPTERRTRRRCWPSCKKISRSRMTLPFTLPITIIPQHAPKIPITAIHRQTGNFVSRGAPQPPRCSASDLPITARTPLLGRIWLRHSTSCSAEKDEPSVTCGELSFSADRR